MNVGWRKVDGEWCVWLEDEGFASMEGRWVAVRSRSRRWADVLLGERIHDRKGRWVYRVVKRRVIPEL